jgi:hypothetical protein
MMTRQTTVAVVIALLAGCLCPAQAQTPSKKRIDAFAKLPDWSGLWEWDVFVGQSVGQQLSPEGLRSLQAYMAAMQPPFNAVWQAKYDQAKRALDAAIAADPNQPPATYQPCVAPLFPATAMPGMYEWRVTPEETTLITTMGSVRHIYTDGRTHPPKDELWPTRMGDSIGHWEGGTLVVDTVATKPELDVLGPELPTAMPLSDQTHFVERIRMLNRNQMQIQFTTKDPVALTKPMQVTLVYERVTDVNRMANENECDPATERNPVVNGRFTTVVR